jgi:hypothetical protein
LALFPLEILQIHLIFFKMKIRLVSIALYFLFFLRTAPGIIPAQAPVRTDYDILESLYSECFRSITAYPADVKGNPVSLSFDGDIIPKEKLNILTEAILSGQGFSITDDPAAAHYRLVIFIHEASVTLQKRNHEFSRDITLHIYARCLDSSGVVLYARNCGNTRSDIISESLQRTTDTGSCFSKNTHRVVLGKKPGKLQIISLLSITTVLAYFGLN